MSPACLTDPLPTRVNHSWLIQSIDNCTKPLGALRQNVFACLTCNPPPANPSDTFNPAGVCYSCSVQCHGEHELVEIFQKRNFTCDCGTTRFTAEQPCTLRINPETNTKGGVHSEPADPNNKYNQNFRNLFCSCAIDYKPHEQKGTMFQCLGLGTHETGGCGEDWYHPGCLVGLGPRWFEKMSKKKPSTAPNNGALPSIAEDAPQEENVVEDGDEDPPLPDGFPEEEEFDHLICYKCVEAHPWIKRYAGTTGFLPPVHFQGEEGPSKKRKLDDEDDGAEGGSSKRIKSEEPGEIGSKVDGSSAPSRLAVGLTSDVPDETKQEDNNKTETPSTENACKLSSLPPTPTGQFSLFVASDFRDRLCRCPSCFPLLKPHPQLLEEEEAYEPPFSDGAGSENGGNGNNDAASSHGGSGGSLLERGESALKNVDRVRAIEGVMAYNHLKEQLTPFFREFAESGRAIGAEDIKEYFAKLRGDEHAIRDARRGAAADGDDQRREQEGF